MYSKENTCIRSSVPTEIIHVILVCGECIYIAFMQVNNITAAFVLPNPVTYTSFSCSLYTHVILQL